DGAWSCQWRALKRSFGGSILAFPGARKCGNGSSLRIYFTNAIVHDVANVDVICSIQRDTVRLRKLRLIGRSAIATETTFAGSCNRRNRFRLHVDETNRVIVAFGDVHVPLAVEAQLMRGIEQCGRG